MIAKASEKSEEFSLSILHIENEWMEKYRK
jgi:hypothetical protein